MELQTMQINQTFISWNPINIYTFSKQANQITHHNISIMNITTWQWEKAENLNTRPTCNLVLTTSSSSPVEDQSLKRNVHKLIVPLPWTMDSSLKDRLITCCHWCWYHHTIISNFPMRNPNIREKNLESTCQLLKNYYLCAELHQFY